MYKVIYKKEWEKDGETKTYWPTIGRGFDAKNGIVLRIDAIPTNWDGALYVVTDEPKEVSQEKSKGSWEQQREKFAAKKDVAPETVEDEVDLSEVPY